MPANSTERFSDRVANYIRYRPDYPAAVIDYLQAETGLSQASIVADIGSGTGIFTRHLIRLGCTVFAIEPNETMREAAEELLGNAPNFTTIAADASNTTLTASTVDLIVCAQAFHWFNTPDTKAEFQRILKPGAYVALTWNNRVIDADDFSKAYEALLQKQSVDYAAVNHQNLQPHDFEAFFSVGYEQASFPNEQLFDEAGLLGRAASSSYVPAEGTEAGAAFIAALKQIFRQYQQDGKVCFRYNTEVYIGRP